jgi:hypothetical protein
MDPKIVSDVFGKRIAKRYIAIQITIANKNKDFQYLIHDVSLDLTAIYKDPASRPRGGYEPSSEDKTLVRGVAEKGQMYDTRNLVIRILEGVGTIAGGITGIATFGSSYAPTVAAFNGPFLDAIKSTFPDKTLNQVNRLNDSAYVSNTVVPKQSAKVMVAFLPQAILLDSSDRAAFWKDPVDLFKKIDLRAIVANADGSFIQEVPEAAQPSITTIVIAEGEKAKLRSAAGFEVVGEILGDHLDSTKLTLKQPAGVECSIEGEPNEKKIKFKLKSDKAVPPGVALVFEVTRNSLSATHSWSF